MRIGLIGSGRMGKVVKEVVAETAHKIIAEFDIDKLMTREAIKECDILIDFSIADAMESNLKIALESKIPMVSGTTGWYERKNEFKTLVEKLDGSFLYASNFSIGILLFHKLLAKAADLYQRFNQYDFSIHEIHHNQKEDSPSGTALTLAKEVLQHLPRKNDLQIGNPSRKIEDNRMQISSSRVGSVPGTHTLYIESPQDSIEITHRARGRFGFASGALQAAEWLIDKKGFFSMDDMIRNLIGE